MRAVPDNPTPKEAKAYLMSWMHRPLSLFSHAEMATRFGLVLLEDHVSGQSACLTVRWTYANIVNADLAEVRRYLEVYYGAADLWVSTLTDDVNFALTPGAYKRFLRGNFERVEFYFKYGLQTTLSDRRFDAIPDPHSGCGCGP